MCRCWLCGMRGTGKRGEGKGRWWCRSACPDMLTSAQPFNRPLHPPTQDPPPKAQFPLAVVQTGEIGAPETPFLNPELQAAVVQLPAKVLVAVPAQVYPVGDLQATAERREGGGRLGAPLKENGRVGGGRHSRLSRPRLHAWIDTHMIIALVHILNS